MSVPGRQALRIIPLARPARAEERADHPLELGILSEFAEEIRERLVLLGHPRLGAERMHAVDRLATDRRADDLSVRAVVIGELLLWMRVHPVARRAHVEPQHHAGVRNRVQNLPDSPHRRSHAVRHALRRVAGLQPARRARDVVDLDPGLAELLHVRCARLALDAARQQGHRHRRHRLAVDHDGRRPMIRLHPRHRPGTRRPSGQAEQQINDLS